MVSGSTSDFRFQTSGFGFELQTSGFRLQVSDFKVHTNALIYTGQNYFEPFQISFQVSGFTLQVFVWRCEQLSNLISGFRFQVSVFRVEV